MDPIAESVLVPLIFFSFLGAVIIVPQVLRSRDRARMYETLRTAYEKGQPVPPELIEAMTRRDVRGDVVEFGPSARSDRDLRRGVVLLAVGLGLVLIGAAFYVGLYQDGGASETFASFAAAGAVPGCIGLAYLGLWYFSRRRPSL
jgi:hypothetical protein